VLDSHPRGATVTDRSTRKPIGKTPVHLVIDGSDQPRQYSFHLHGYGDTTIELVPDRDKIEYVEQLVKGRSTGVVHSIASPARNDVQAAGADASPGAVARPETGNEKPADGAGSSAAAKPADGTAASDGSNASDGSRTTKAATPGRTGEGSGNAAEPKCNDEDVPCLKGFGSAK
jgi:hypothetical protein